MTFSWNHYLDVSRRLGASSRTKGEHLWEAYARSSISRAYYAAFGVARELLCAHGFVNTQSSRIHQDLIDALMNDPVLRQAGLHLNVLRQRRNDADYEASFPGDLMREQGFALNNAEKVIRVLRAKFK